MPRIMDERYVSPGPPSEDARRAAEANGAAARWVLRIACLLLLALVALCMIGPHIPSGE